MRKEGIPLAAYCFDRTRYESRIRWFQSARFGLFLHFGLYSVPARGEWVRSNEQMPESDYMPFFESFNPQQFDAKAWARAAKQAGMRYAVLTAKHHDGFCLFDSQYTDFKSTATPFGRDIVREFLDAFRSEGLRVGLYYSLLDWHHPDYPHFADRYHPMREDATQTNENRNWDNYIAYYHNQVRELCTNYGKLDLLWFDFSYDHMRGETWHAAQLMEMVRALQPDILIDNRLEVSGEGFGSLYSCCPTSYHGDFVTPEKMIPPHGLQDVENRDLCWESCVTMNNNWGYCRDDENYKPASLIIKKLVECVSKGGNLILNVGPMGNGAFPSQALATLRQIGDWMAVNSESIYSCGKAGLEKPDCGRFTRRGNTLYLHVYENSIGPLPVPQLRKSQIRSATRLFDGSEIQISTSWVHSDYPDV
ncbi:MAG: alpha-L-fucosidase, partial [Faecousia sp.]